MCRKEKVLEKGLGVGSGKELDGREGTEMEFCGMGGVVVEISQQIDIQYARFAVSGIKRVIERS